MSSWLWFTLSGLVVTVVLTGSEGCAKKSSTEAAPAASGKSLELTVSPELLQSGRFSFDHAERRPMREELLVSGQVVAPPSGKAEIGALMTARVHEVFVIEGTKVDKGKLLATLDAPDAARIVGELASARAKRTHAETVLKQEKELSSERATSARALTEASSNADAARAEELSTSMLLETYGVSGNRLLLRAPLTGVIVNSQTVLGAQVNAGTTLFKIVDLSQLMIRADVPENRADAITLGEKARIRLPASGRFCEAKLTSSTHSVDPLKRTVSFRLEPDATCGPLLEGGFVDVLLSPYVVPTDSSVTTGNQPNPSASAQTNPPSGIAVPRDAVVEIDSVPVVFIATETPGHFRYVPVTIGLHTETTSYVTEGLVGGESVVTHGALLLKGELLKERLE